MVTAKKLLTVVLMIAITTTLFSFDLPTGWLRAGSHPKSYDMGIDKGAGQNGKAAATIKSTAKKINGFGTLMQNPLARQLSWQKSSYVRLTQTQDVTDWAGLWFRVDEKGTNTSSGFDNMKDGKRDRSVKGTTDWMRY